MAERKKRSIPPRARTMLLPARTRGAPGGTGRTRRAPGARAPPQADAPAAPYPRRSRHRRRPRRVDRSGLRPGRQPVRRAPGHGWRSARSAGDPAARHGHLPAHGHAVLRGARYFDARRRARRWPPIGASWPWPSARPKWRRSTPSDLYPMGVELAIGRVLKMPDGTTALLVQGQHRVRIKKYIQTHPYLRARGRGRSRRRASENLPTEAMMRAVLALFEKVVKMSRNLPRGRLRGGDEHRRAGLAGRLRSPRRCRLDAGQAPGRSWRRSTRASGCKSSSILLAKELDVLELESRIQTQVQKEVDKTQREYLPARADRRRSRTSWARTTRRRARSTSCASKIEAAGMPEEVHEKAIEELDRLAADAGRWRPRSA